MKRDFLDKSSQYLRFQRNVFAAISICLAVSLIMSSSFLFLKRERVVITPAVIEKEFWVDGRSVSPTYLEQFGYFLGQLLLGKSAYSAPSQRTLLLRHTDPQFVHILRKKLIEEEENLTKQNASYTFFPISVRVNQDRNEVLLEGDRVFFVSGKQVSSERESYILSFNLTGSRLLLSGVTAFEEKGAICTK